MGRVVRTIIQSYKKKAIKEENKNNIRTNLTLEPSFSVDSLNFYLVRDKYIYVYIWEELP